MPIFDIFGKKQEKLNFDLPFYEFEDGEMIAVKKLIIEWQYSGTTVAGLISTDIVDKCPTNPRQQICAFMKRHNDIITEIDFATPVYYYIQRHSFIDATISVESLFERKIQEIKNVYIQFVTK